MTPKQQSQPREGGEPRGTFACPICGRETIHGHDSEEKRLWILAQAERLDVSLNLLPSTTEPTKGDQVLVHGWISGISMRGHATEYEISMVTRRPNAEVVRVRFERDQMNTFTVLRGNGAALRAASQSVSAAGEHEPQLYAAQGLVTGNDGTFTVGFLGCSCGWNSDGKAEEKYSAHLRAGRQEQPREAQIRHDVYLEISDEFDAEAKSAPEYSDTQRVAAHRARVYQEKARAALAATPATDRRGQS